MTNSRTPKYLRTALLSMFLISSVQVLIVLINYFNSQPVVPLFYSLARKSQYLVRKEWLFLLPLISYVMTLVHLFILRAMKDYEPLLLKIFAWTTVGFQVILSLALVRIILIIR